MRNPGYRQIKRLFLCAGAALALSVPAARAEPFPPALEADYAFAVDWWGATPSGCLSLELQLVNPAAIPGRGGQATQPIEGTAPIPCEMDIATGISPNCFRREVILHEYGHLLGFGHVDAPSSIMSGTALPGCCAGKSSILNGSGGGI